MPDEHEPAPGMGYPSGSFSLVCLAMASTADTDPDIAARLTEVRRQISAAAAAHARTADDITLVAISKKKPAAMIRAALAHGQRDFGENYLQDALVKIDALRDAEPAPVWHFVGDIQSNKTKDIATYFAWAHAVDRFKIARRLSEQRPDGMAALNICIQVNIDDEASKSGVAPDEVADLAQQIAELDGVKLRGLMAIPAVSEGLAAQRAPFARLAAIRDDLRGRGHVMDTLSIGMSADIEAAIAEGATHVRIGTAIFGARES